MNKPFLFLLFLLGISRPGVSQPNYTANEQVTPYNQPFRYGANLGNYPPWTNQQVADVAVGTGTLPGIGVNAFRGSLPEHFLETWGYNIRLPDYQHYQSVGAMENLAFIGYPSEAHRDQGTYCDTLQSALFANMYLPIWDGGANGTPVNDQNYYALYLWKMVNIYKPYIRFWEVWNEPDFAWDQTASNSPPGAPGNWWDNDPDPCNNAMVAPVEHYVRMLRISWEVIKTADPNAYICVGGLGNPAFLDAILRNTDNPAGGTATADYPLGGGAYFDVLSFHSYPHLDGSMWEYPPGGGLFFYRHSDRGVDGMLARKQIMEQVLASRDYDGVTHPEKLWLLSETNIPRKEFNLYIGSDEAQRNYITKALTEAHKTGILQLYLFNIADLNDEPDAWKEFLLMGLFKNLSPYTYPGYELNDAAVAWQTTSSFFTGRTVNENLMAALALPPGINGAAFSSPADTLFVLWARTTVDQSEQASATFSFPPALELDTLYRMEWDHSMTQDTAVALAGNVLLTGSPAFFMKKPPYVEPEDTTMIDAVRDLGASFGAKCFPNPSSGDFTLEIDLKSGDLTEVSILNGLGSTVHTLLNNQLLLAGKHRLVSREPLPSGIFWIKIRTENNGMRFLKLVVEKAE